MDSESLFTDIEYLAGAGIVLGTELKAALQSSLVDLKQAERFHKILFWGKIAGITRDYYIAQGIYSNPINDKKSFFSLDGIKWAQVASVHPVLVTSAAKIQARFTGNPSHEYVVTEVAPGNAPEVPDEVKSFRTETARDDGSKVVNTNITEEKRLAAAVALLDSDNAIIPRGALRTSPTGKIEYSRTFEGLSAVDALNLQSYLHLRPAELIQRQPLLERAKLDRAIDFLDTIAQDTPHGLWNIQAERGGSVVYVRSLLWPGFVFYHVVGTAKYGHVYFGLVHRNLDLPFML